MSTHAQSGRQAKSSLPPPALNPVSFRRRLISWYRLHARALPWRETSDPYRIWVSEIMLQQTRVTAVIDYYNEFLRRFPTLVALSLATEADVLAAWSGLGYYRRARMLHKAAQFIVLERNGVLPTTAAELRTLPGIGEYTAAAIASIAFGEPIAVVDGNVERVILRLTGGPADSPATEGARMRAFIRDHAQAFMPPRRIIEAPLQPAPAKKATRNPAGTVWDASERIAIAAASHPEQAVLPPLRLYVASQDDYSTTQSDDPAQQPVQPIIRTNAAGDHNQAMMELGATICLPQAPLCLQCPVYALCRTRGEHPTTPRAPQLSRPVAYLLDLRKDGSATEVLLELRPRNSSLMPSMFELPPLPLEAVAGREPVLRVRHAITGTNYYVQVYAARGDYAESSKAARADAEILRRAVPSSGRDLHWVRTTRLTALPLTGLTRKILHRLKVMEGPAIDLLQ